MYWTFKTMIKKKSGNKEHAKNTNYNNSRLRYIVTKKKKKKKKKKNDTDLSSDFPLGRPIFGAINFFPCMNCKKEPKLWDVSRWLSHCSCIYLFLSLTMMTYVHFYMAKTLGFSCRGRHYFCFVWFPSVLTDVLFLVWFILVFITILYTIW